MEGEEQLIGKEGTGVARAGGTAGDEAGADRMVGDDVALWDSRRDTAILGVWSQLGRTQVERRLLGQAQTARLLWDQVQVVWPWDAG